MPKLKSSNDSRILIVSCADHLKGEINFEDLNSAKNYNADFAYNQSKLANVLFGMELSERLKDTGVTVNCVIPGYTYTDHMKNASVYKSPYSPVSFFFKIFLKTPIFAAQTVVFASVSPRLENVTGKFVR